jgi:hypothetical protein
MDRPNRARRLRDLSPITLTRVAGGGSLPTESLALNFTKLSPR